MQYILTDRPAGGESQRAFDALDNAFGVEGFSGSEADKVLAENGFNSSMFDSLIQGSYVAEDE